MTEAPPRRLAIGDTYNWRDVGGYRTTDDAVTAWGRLFRSDLPILGENGGAELADLGIHTVVDLREPGERRARPSELEGLMGHVGRVVHRPFGVGGLLAQDPALRESLGKAYSAAVRLLGPQIAAVVTSLGEVDAFPALVHCAAGKDRTGIIIGLVLSMIGVPDETVAADYALTADYLTADFFRGLDPAGSPVGHIDLTPLHGATPDAMLETLAAARSIGGDVAGYLTGQGVTPQTLHRLRTALVV